MTAATPGRPWLEAHLPHRGRMNLLEAVAWWDETAIRCTATSHRDPANPLRRQGELPAAAAIEYAAQAAAAHGALLAGGALPQEGFLASVRAVRFGARRLDDIEGPLALHAQRVGGDEEIVLYTFRVEGGDRPLASGRLAVFTGSIGQRANGGAPA